MSSHDLWRIRPEKSEQDLWCYLAGVSCRRMRMSCSPRRGSCPRVLVFRSGTETEIGAGESVLSDFESAVFCRSSVRIQGVAVVCD